MVYKLILAYHRKFAAPDRHSSSRKSFLARGEFRVFQFVHCLGLGVALA